jgi:3',5'-cyclic AMP phosphodiesterase CpdA
MSVRLLVAAAFALRALAADPFFFIQASDPQFGLFANDRDFRQETANWEFVIANVDRIHPAFLIVTGDLTNKPRDADQIAEYKRINARLNAGIHLYSVPGNHDVGNEPTPALLAAYRKNYGPDYYSFREGPIYGIVLNSNLMKSPEGVTDEAAKQEAWLKEELSKARAAAAIPVVFQHIPFFLEKPDEPDQYFNIPFATRRRVLALLHSGGVHYVFAGHYHRNSYGRDGNLEMITTGPAGIPLGADPSGIRIAEIKDGAIVHDYYSLGRLPNAWPPPPPPPPPPAR